MIQFYNETALQEKHDEVYQSCARAAHTLPPGITEQVFEAAMSEFAAAIGEAHVVSGADMINFQDPYPLDPGAHKASGALCPGSVEDVQAIVRIANNYCLPLWIVSRGKNFGYGGPAPRQSGSIVVSLHRMNRIIDVNETLAYVVVEPGVTFFDLDGYFKKNHIDLWISAPALGWGSVVGNTLDRGHGYTISGDRQHQIASMEVVLPSGQLLRTGQWGVTNSPSTHACSNNFGPQIDGLFLQSNLGIVTKLAVYVDAAPPAYMNVIVNCPEVEHIASLIDSLQQLFREDMLQNHIHIVNINHFSSRDSRKHMQQQQNGPLTKETLDRMREKYRTGYWRAALDLYGTEEMITLRFNRIKQVLAQNVPGSWLDHTLFKGENGRPVDNRQVATLGAGFPNMIGASLADYNLPADGSGAGAHIDVTLILPSVGKVTLDWFVRMRQLMESHGADPFIGCHVFNRHILFVQEYVFDKTQAAHRDRGQKVLSAIMGAAKEAGFANYRSHLDHMDAIQDLYDFNGHIYKSIVTDLKSLNADPFGVEKAVLDPNGIIAPGKQGIWPKSTNQE